MASYVDNGNKLDWALPFQRTGDFPLDRSSMFSSYADAVKYAAGNYSNPDSRGLQGSSYVGQIITVFENNVVNVYKIEADRSLTLVGAGADDYTDLSNKPSINNVTLIGDKTSADLGLASQASITEINSKIPNQASSTNQLADKDFVNSSISTATATFRGTYDSLPALQAASGDRNDYAFYRHTDAAGNTIYDRYKYVGVPDSRVPEGYTERLYLTQATNASSYIDTGYKVQSTDKIVIKYYGFEYTATEALLLGAKDSNNNFFQLRKDYGTATMYLETNNGSVALGNGYNRSFIIEVYDGKVYVSDIDGENKQLKGSLALSSVDANLYVFRSNDNGTPTSYYNQWIRIGDFTIYDSNDNKVLELVPCTDSLSVNGYYETVTETFIEPTDGNLDAQAISADRWVYEYTLNNSSFTSAQWAAINSGVTTGTVSAVSGIQSLIPSQATVLNQLADKDYVNTSISTATAEFKGTFTSLQALQATDGDRNDYAFYEHTDSAGNTVYDRYKYVGLPDTRVPVEYTEVYSIGITNNSGPHINTGIVLKNNYSIETTMTFGAVNYYTNRYYWGANDGTNYFRLQKPGTSILRVDYSGGTSNTVGIDNAEYLIEVKNNKFYIDGSLSGNAVVPNIGDDYPLYLFGYNNQGSLNTNGTITTSFHTFKVWDENGNIILDLVPCRNYENEAGMYDVVSGQFFGGSFSTTPLSTDRWVYEYTLNNSSFTAAQWAAINSGIISEMIPSTASSTNKLLTLDTLPIYNGGVQNG